MWLEKRKVLGGDCRVRGSICAAGGNKYYVLLITSCYESAGS
jgi:hypothetical protein